MVTVPKQIGNPQPNEIMNQMKKSMILVCGLALTALPAAFAGDAGDKFKLMDTNADGRVSKTEHSAAAQTMFARMDANNDGTVTVAEMEASHDEKKTSKLKFWDKKEKLSASEKISAVDLNADGQLTRAEHENASETMFTRMDTDNDGYLSKDECEKGHKLLEKQHDR